MLVLTPTAVRSSQPPPPQRVPKELAAAFLPATPRPRVGCSRDHPRPAEQGPGALERGARVFLTRTLASYLDDKVLDANVDDRAGRTSC